MTVIVEPVVTTSLFLATTQKILHAGYFWPTIFVDFVHVGKHNCNLQLFGPKVRTPPALLHLVVIVGPFYKWAINFMTCNPPSSDEHKYIIVAIDHFTKWTKAIHTFNYKVDNASLFYFNHVIAHFGFPLQLVLNHISHFKDIVWTELSAMLKFEHQYSSDYYPRGNGQVEVVNKILKTMLQ